MAKLSTNKIARAIYLATKGKSGAELSVTLKNARGMLSRRRLLSRSPEILDSLGEIIDQESGKLRVRLKSAIKIKDSTKKEIARELQNRYPAKEFVFLESIDEGLLGGVRIEIGDEVIDLSVKKKVGQLQEYLIRTV